MNISDYFNPLQITFAQAVSICSIITDLGLMRFDIEDAVNGLADRHNTTFPTEMFSIVQDAVTFGCTEEVGMFTQLDTDTFALTAHGIAIGKDWSKRVHQDL